MSDFGLAIKIGFSIIFLIGGIAYCFAVLERKWVKPGPVDLETKTRAQQNARPPAGLPISHQADECFAHVRLWHKADMAAPPINVRFWG
jgi:hypothetical protein